MGYYELVFIGGKWQAYDVYAKVIICSDINRNDCIVAAEKMGYTWEGA